MMLLAHPLAMDLINIAIARDASSRGLLGARLDDPVVPETPGLLTRARRKLARSRGQRPAARHQRVAHAGGAPR
jgi:hypothetical protein